jgi:drug/metabolite transporter (DMT)-like permease
MKTWILLLVLFCGLMGATGQVFFKLASKNLSFDVIELIKNWQLWVGLTLYGLATILFLFALSKENLSILYPLIASSYIWVTIFSVWFLHETFVVYKWIGIALIMIGITIITI